jgi:hypothetical protein
MTPKVAKNNHGCLIGTAGHGVFCHLVRNWFLEIEKVTAEKPFGDLSPPVTDEGSGAILVAANGDVYDLSQGVIMKSSEFDLYGFVAIGCGCDFGFGAMAAGASAIEAAEISTRFSNDCGGEVHSVRLDSMGATNGPA